MNIPQPTSADHICLHEEIINVHYDTNRLLIELIERAVDDDGQWMRQIFPNNLEIHPHLNWYDSRYGTKCYDASQPKMPLNGWWIPKPRRLNATERKAWPALSLSDPDLGIRAFKEECSRKLKGPVRKIFSFQKFWSSKKKCYINVILPNVL